MIKHVHNFSLPRWAGSECLQLLGTFAPGETSLQPSSAFQGLINMKDINFLNK